MDIYLISFLVIPDRLDSIRRYIGARNKHQVLHRLWRWAPRVMIIYLTAVQIFWR